MAVGDIPLLPESVVDYALGLSLYFSRDEQERKYGEDSKKWWDTLRETYKSDKRASKFLDNVNAVISGTVYNLAELRKQVSDRYAYLDKVEKERIKDLDDIVSLTSDAESIATRVAGVAVGGGGVTVLSLASSTFGSKELLTVIAAGGLAYLLVEVFLRLYRMWDVPRILKFTQKEKDNTMNNQFHPKVEATLEELLKKVNKITKEAYPTKGLEEDSVKTIASAFSTAFSSSGFITGSGKVTVFGPPSARRPSEVHGP